MKIKTKPNAAFTLAELLMAVLVISIIMVALAPVITRRMSDNISIEVNRRTGDEIFENPGSYSFDVPIGIDTLTISAAGGGGGGGGASMKTFEKEFYTDTVWTVPQGVFEVTLTLAGAGGGGGNAAAKTSSKTTCGSLDFDRHPQPSGAVKIKEFMIVRGAEDGRNLCFFTENIDGNYSNAQGVSNYSTTDSTDVCISSGRCCWKHSLYPSTCEPYAAATLCGYYPHAESRSDSGALYPERETYRLPTPGEWQYIQTSVQNAAKENNMTLVKDITYSLNLKYGQYITGCSDKRYPSAFGIAGSQIIQDAYEGCMGASGSCSPAQYFRSDQRKIRLGSPACWYPGVDEQGRPASTRCVKPLDLLDRYSGGGGASGALWQDLRIKVRPGDTLALTVGKGGNSASSAGASGIKGGSTIIVHNTKTDSGSVVRATYTVSGGLGGGGGTAASGTQGQGGKGGEANSSKSVLFSPNITNNIVKSQGSLLYSNAGQNGSTSNGGAGSALSGESGSVQGGYFQNDAARGWNIQCTKSERDAAQGRSAKSNITDRQYGFGGGGGFAPSFANSVNLMSNTTSNVCGMGKGGSGGGGYVRISYTQFSPGGGGGGGASIKDYQYDVRDIPELGGLSGVKRIYFTVGSGGAGAQAGNAGSDGEETNIMNGAIVLSGGLGGGAGRIYSSFCIAPSSCQYLGGYGGLGGNAQSWASIGVEDGIAGFEGSKNKEIGGSLNNDSYGFSGGRGGNTQFESYGGCGGVQNDKIPDSNACIMGENYDGSNAQKHFVNSSGESVNGGNAGGGGGAGGDSASLNAKRGAGGAGASGYVRIKWGGGG